MLLLSCDLCRTDNLLNAAEDKSVCGAGSPRLISLLFHLSLPRIIPLPLHLCTFNNLTFFGSVQIKGYVVIAAYQGFVPDDRL